MRNLFLLQLLVGLTLSVPVAAQVEVVSFSRGVMAESGIIDPVLGIVDRLENQNTFDGLGAYVQGVEAGQSDLLCGASQNTNAVTLPGIPSVSGSMEISFALTATGDKCYYFPRSYVWVDFIVASEVTCRLAGLRGDQAEASFYVANWASGEEASYALGPGEFELNHVLSEAGAYRCQIILYRQYASETVFSEDVSMGFEFEIVEGAVAVEGSTWGGVKALYR